MKLFQNILFGLFVIASTLTMYLAKDKFAALGVVAVVGIYFVARIVMLKNIR
jgi:hypothetical protein